MTSPSQPPPSPEKGDESAGVPSDLDSSLPPELRPLIDAERERPLPTPDVVERIRRGVEQHLEAGTSTAFADLGRPRPAKLPAIVTHALSFGLGLAAGAMLHAAWPVSDLSPPPAPTVVEQRPSSPVPSAPPATDTLGAPQADASRPALDRAGAVAAMDAAVGPLEQGPPTVHRVRQPAPLETADASTERGASASSLVRERILIEGARVALQEGRSADALSACRQHGREFPHGMLLEDRLSLQVRALVALGHVDAARQRYREFQRRFPRSLHRLSLRRALEQAASESTMGPQPHEELAP